MAITCPPARHISNFVAHAKTPVDELDYMALYGQWLASIDVIIESTWSIEGPDSALEAFNAQIVDEGQSTAIWLKGGTLGATYRVFNTITTDQARVLKRSFELRIVEFLP